MSMPHLDRTYTVDEVMAFPEDGNRYELVAGQLLVTPSPRQVHQLVLGELHMLVNGFVKAHPAAGVAFLSPADITWGDDNLVQPDLFVVPREEVTGDWRVCQTLTLAVEVLSPSSGRADRFIKRRLYQARGVHTYWIVDADARLVEVWRPEDERPEIVSESLVWAPDGAGQQLVIPLAQLFQPIG